jgi:hypothetical protein
MQEVLTTFVNYQLVLDVSLYIPACVHAYTRHVNSARVHVQYMYVGGCHRIVPCMRCRFCCILLLLPSGS